MTNDMTLAVVGRFAGGWAMEGAADYLKSRNAAHTADVDALVTLLKSETAAGIGAAMDEMKAALDAGMDNYIGPVLKANMRLVGIRAAKKLLGEVSR